MIILLNNCKFSIIGKRLSVKNTNNFDKVASKEYKHKLSIKSFLTSSLLKLSSFKNGK